MSLKTQPGAGVPVARDNPLVAVWQTAPPDRQELLRRIAALGQRIAAYVDFMGQANDRNGASAEAKDKAIAAFYEKLLVVERQLARIHDNFRLE